MADFERQINRLLEKLAKFQNIGNDKRIDVIMNRIGQKFETEMKANLTRSGSVNTRNLLLRTGFRLRKDGTTRTLEVGTFGVLYAAAVEFPSNNYTERVRRAMFAKLRRSGQLTGISKGVIDFAAGEREARPYLKPAFDMLSPEVLATLRVFIREGFF